MDSKIDLVWARIKYNPYWPARIVERPPELANKASKDKICVLFFGTKDFGFVEKQFVCNYVENRQKYVLKGRGIDFRNAVQRMDEYIADPTKYAKNACVKPTSKTITVKKERAPIIKSECDMNNAPFESTIVECGPTNVVDDLEKKVTELSLEKTKLIEELVATKGENQTLFFDVQNQQQQISVLKNEQNVLQNKLEAQQQEVDKLQREKNGLQAKVKQLMATTSAEKTDDEDEYEVQDILDHKIVRNDRRFLIHWRNYSPSHDSWESEKNLNCPQILQTYLRKIKK